MSQKSRTLEIDEDLNFQRKEWFVQRVGTATLFACVLAAMLGLTGMGGPFSNAVAGEPAGPIRVEYNAS